MRVKILSGMERDAKGIKDVAFGSSSFSIVDAGKETGELRSVNAPAFVN